MDNPFAKIAIIAKLTQSDFLVGRNCENCENDQIEDLFRKNEEFRDLV